MPVAHDSNAKFDEYFDSSVLVSTEWLQDNLSNPDLVVVESDEDVLLYEVGHIEGAVKVDWHLDLNDSSTRDFLDGEAFSKLMSRKGISRDATVVIYGDKSNWWAAYALWIFKLFGHEDVRLLDGGRDKWVAEGRKLTKDEVVRAAADYPVIPRDDSTLRAFRHDVLEHFGNPLIDVRSTEEYTGERTHMPSYPEEGALRGGHIPTAKSVPWSRAAGENGVFRSLAELKTIYQDEAGLAEGDDVIAYCRIGERSSHTWFVLNYLLGFKNVRNYDGSWTEWGNAVAVPIATGTEPGSLPIAKASLAGR